MYTRCAGSYSEMYTFVSQRTPLLPKRPSNPNAAFIVSAFKTAGNLDSLDRSWTVQYWIGSQRPQPVFSKFFLVLYSANQLEIYWVPSWFRPVSTGSVLDSLDRSWTYWSGADYVVEHIPKSLRLERLTFHKLLRHGGHGHGKENNG